MQVYRMAYPFAVDSALMIRCIVCSCFVYRMTVSDETQRVTHWVTGSNNQSKYVVGTRQLGSSSYLRSGVRNVYTATRGRRDTFTYAYVECTCASVRPTKRLTRCNSNPSFPPCAFPFFSSKYFNIKYATRRHLIYHHFPCNFFLIHSFYISIVNSY